MAGDAVVMWSGGKDSAMALHEVLRDGAHRVVTLLTTVTEGYDRISIHGVRRSLLHRQAESLGIPVTEVWVSRVSSNAEYEARMDAALAGVRERWPGVEAVVCGDIFLADVRHYREMIFGRHGLRGLFPLWGRGTGELARSFIARGYRAVLTCVDSRTLDRRFAGRELDAALLRELPPGVDACGENGEFHTFVYDGPIFAAPVTHERGEIVLRDDRFVYADLIDAEPHYPRGDA